MSVEPVIAQKKPFAVTVECGKSYWWCTCGRSKTQPFCDGSHRGSAFSPVEFKAEKDETVYLCGCKHTARRPHCDGTHRTLA